MSAHANLPEDATNRVYARQEKPRMKNATLRIGAAALLAASLVTSCATTTLVSQWADKDYQGKKLERVMIIGVAKKDMVRRQFEDSFATSITNKHTFAMTSYKDMPDPSNITKELAEPLIVANKITHIIVTRIVDHKTVTTYVPPSTTVYTSGYPGYYPGYYNSWNGYYSAGYSAVTTPGYTYDTEYVNLETNVYDVATGKMIWSGLSQTELGGSVESHIADVIEVVTGAMKSHGML
jgi:hypothetical protein